MLVLYPPISPFRYAARDWFLFAAAFLLLLPTLCQAQTYTISTFAGPQGVGDNGPATGAFFNSPGRVAVDSAGNVYISDTLNHRIRKVSTTGMISTFAGSNAAGFSGDGGPAAEARLHAPGGITLDKAGNMYIADARNHRIRKVSAAGIITTVAGNGNGDFGGDRGPASRAQLFVPTDVALDSAGNLYIADNFNNRIRRVGPDGVIVTVAGTVTRGFSGDGGPATAAELYDPVAIATDSSDNLYIADRFNRRIRKVSAGMITTIAGDGRSGNGGDGGPATAAQIDAPSDLAVDSEGNVFIATGSGSRIRRVTAGTITTVAGDGNSFAVGGDGGPAALAQIGNAVGVEVDSAGAVYIVEILFGVVRKVEAGIITTIAGAGLGGFRGDGGAAIDARFSGPQGIAVGPQNNVYVADRGNGRIRKITPAGTITTIAGNGGLTPGREEGPATSVALGAASDVAVDSEGIVYVPLPGGIRKIDTSGILSILVPKNADGGVALPGLDSSAGIALDRMGNIYVSENFRHQVRRIDPAGTITVFAGNGTRGGGGFGGPAANAQLDSPAGIAADNRGNVYIADQGNNRIQIVDSNGVISTAAGRGVIGPAIDGGPATEAWLWNPSDVAGDGEGNIFIADTNHHRIRKVDSMGIITTIAGGIQGFGGDGGPATDAQLNRPSGVAVGSDGKIYVADTTNGRIRLLTPVLDEPPAPPKPSVAEYGVLSAATFAKFGQPGHAVALGSLVSIFGQNFTDGGHFEADALPLPTNLGGVSVTFNGVPARIFGVWPNQINAQFPPGIGGLGPAQSGGSQGTNFTTTVVVQSARGPSDPRTVVITQRSPGIFTATAQGTGQGIVVFANTATLAAPVGYRGDSRPARAGDLLTIYATGLGLVDPPIEGGDNSCEPDSQCLPDYSNLVLRRTILTPQVTVGGVQVPQDKVFFSGLAPEFVAVNIVIIELPAGIAPGDNVPLTIAIGGSESPPGVTIAVE